MIWRALPYAIYRRARIHARKACYVYLHMRHKVRMRLIRIERAKARRNFLAMPVDVPVNRWPTVNDSSNSVGRCRRENGLR